MCPSASGCQAPGNCKGESLGVDGLRRSRVAAQPSIAADRPPPDHLVGAGEHYGRYSQADRGRSAADPFQRQ
jgi:hypothetical protein